MTGNAFLAPSKTKLFGGGRFDINLINIAAYICCEIEAHFVSVRQHFWLLSDNGDIDIAQFVAFAGNHGDNRG